MRSPARSGKIGEAQQGWLTGGGDGQCWVDNRHRGVLITARTRARREEGGSVVACTWRGRAWLCRTHVVTADGSEASSGRAAANDASYVKGTRRGQLARAFPWHGCLWQCGCEVLQRRPHGGWRRRPTTQ
jgi:hypothetical protein